ncbi:hypothetical protein H7849_22520 [Alloacidobacterium dinghuense]|uniref:Uncharacterized protein n=1 Tax=Alloacidobacterium dinghuense TaxID=2763107 RepID=A0A7G8BRG1_9BACT|nr:hypothetical protein [Alloacidobacterium dinghuense]QNI35131.1 hypothetical protein H7849_22520 [Alloacidobacterium dinghuense]
MRRRTRITIGVVVVILLLLLVAFYLRMKAPPEAARLLPESDGIVYLNLRPIRTVTHFDQHPVTHDPDYQSFIDATGIQFERDLDEAAFALHRMPDPAGPNGLVAFSEVFVGHFDGRRLTHYLEGLSTSRENYAGHIIYSIPSDGRTVRVTLPGYDMVAVSNTPTSEQIHSILDRYRTAALPFAGSSLLTDHYEEVPLLSLAWGIGQIGLPFGDSGNVSIFGLKLPITFDSTFIASLRWTGSLRLRIEEIAPTEEAAASSADSLRMLLNFARNAEAAAPGITDAELRPLLDSIQIEHHRDRAVLHATVTPQLLERLVTPPGKMQAPLAPAGGSK